MKTLTKTLITTFIIFSIACMPGERKPGIGLALNHISVQQKPVLENVKSYQPQKIASRKKTATKHN